MARLGNLIFRWTCAQCAEVIPVTATPVPVTIADLKANQQRLILDDFEIKTHTLAHEVCECLYVNTQRIPDDGCPIHEGR